MNLLLNYKLVMINQIVFLPGVHFLCSLWLHKYSSAGDVLLTHSFYHSFVVHFIA